MAGWLLEWLDRYFAPAGYMDPLFHQHAEFLADNRALLNDALIGATRLAEEVMQGVYGQQDNGSRH